MTTPVLAAAHISKSFGDHLVLNDVSFEVNEGEAVCLLGPSGSGKSTLLRCLNMLERPDRGVVLLRGELMGYRHTDGRLVELPDRLESKQRRRLGMVFQQFNLFPHMTVLDNVTLGPQRVLGRDEGVCRSEALNLLEKVGLSDKKDAYPGQLSGGQQQRVAIARALAMKPEALLFDEPTSALDPELVAEVLQVIRDLVREGMTSIIVTHEVGFAREVCDRFMFMEAGRIVEEGPGYLLQAGAKHESTRRFLAKVL